MAIPIRQTKKRGRPTVKNDNIKKVEKYFLKLRHDNFYPQPNPKSTQ